MSDTQAAQDHWSAVWKKADPTQVSWYETEPAHSLELIRLACGGDTSRSVIDVGAGQSALLESLLDAGFSSVSGLDVAPQAVRALESTVGDRADLFAADVRTFRADRTWHVWHDRAVFHFLTDSADRERYADTLHAHLAEGGHAIIATFAPDGPKRCSGLPTMRYDGPGLARTLGLELVEERRVTHRKPNGDTQAFCYALLRRAA